MSPAPSWLTETPPTSCLSSTTWGTASWSWTRRWARRGCWRRPSSTTSPTSSSYSRRGYITGITAASRMGSMFTGEDLWQFIKTLYYGNPPTMQGAAVPRGWADPNGVNHERWMEVWTGTHRYYEDFEDYELELWVGQTNYYYFFIKGWGGYSYTKFLKWTNCSFPWNFNSFSFFFNSKKVQHSLFFSWEHHLSKFLERELLFADLIYRCIYLKYGKASKIISLHLLLSCALIPSLVFIWWPKYQITDYITHVFQLINIGSHYQYGSDDHAEFLCVVSREYPDNTNATDKVTEPTDRAKVSQIVSVSCVW